VELIEVFPRRVFETLGVEDEALDEVLLERGRSPAAELDAALGTDPVADRQNHLEVVVVHLVGLAVGGSCCIACNN